MNFFNFKKKSTSEKEEEDVAKLFQSTLQDYLKNGKQSTIGKIDKLSATIYYSAFKKANIKTENLEELFNTALSKEKDFSKKLDEINYKEIYNTIRDTIENMICNKSFHKYKNDLSFFKESLNTIKKEVDEHINQLFISPKNKKKYTEVKMSNNSKENKDLTQETILESVDLPVIIVLENGLGMDELTRKRIMNVGIESISNYFGATEYFPSKGDIISPKLMPTDVNAFEIVEEIGGDLFGSIWETLNTKPPVIKIRWIRRDFTKKNHNNS